MTRHVNQQPCSYLVVHLLGNGNFADMHLSEHTYPKKQVILKALPPQLTELAVEDFLAVARYMSQLLHPHIMRIVDIGLVLPTSTTGMSDIADLFGKLAYMVPKFIAASCLQSDQYVLDYFC